MAYNVSTTFGESQVKVDNVFPLEMYCINASQSGWLPMYYANINQDIIGYTVTVNGTVTNTEVLYTGLPIKTGSIKSDIQGETAGIDISVPNTNRVIESIIQSQNYLRGCEAYILLTYADYLPTGSTADYIGVDPDHLACIKEKFYIDSCTSNKEVVTFTLKNKLNIKGITVPQRIYSNECYWAMSNKYRGTECLGNGSINATTYPTCDGTLEQCRERSNVARFGGFPSVPSRGIVIL